MSDMYKFAAQNRLRFPSSRGALTVEDLYEMPLQSKSGFDLDSVAKAINASLKSVSEESFVDDSASSPQKKLFEVSLEIVKDVIATKKAENQAVVARQNRAIERKKLLDAIAGKKDEALSKASLDELEKKLAELDA